MDITLIRVIIPFLDKAADGVAWFEVFKVLFQGFITAGFGLLFALWLKHLWFDAERTKKEENERELIIEELKDLDRHFKANDVLLTRIIDHNESAPSPEMPSLLLLRQLHIPGDYFILSKNNLHGLHNGFTRSYLKNNV